MEQFYNQKFKCIKSFSLDVEGIRLTLQKNKTYQLKVYMYPNGDDASWELTHGDVKVIIPEKNIRSNFVKTS